MKTVGKIFSTIGGILSLITGVWLVLAGALFLCLAIPGIKDSLYELLQKLADQTNAPIMDYVDYIIPVAITSAIFVFISAIFFFIAGALSLKAHKKDSYVPSIVFGVITGFQVFIVLGAIFGIIFRNRNKDNA